MPSHLIQRAHDLLSRRSVMQETSAFMQGDHWHGGDGWIGPRLPNSDRRSVDVLAEIQRGFVTREVINELARRHRDAVIGTKPHWTVTVRRPLKDDEQPTAQEQALIDEAEAALTQWWDANDVMGTLQDAAMTLLWASENPQQASERKARHGKRAVRRTVSPLRVYIPESRAPNGEVRGNLEQVIKIISVSHLSPLTGGVIRDLDGEPIAGFYLYEDDQHRELIEIVATGRRMREFELLEGNANDDDTVVQIRRLTADAAVVDEAIYDLGGLSLYHEMNREPLITDAILSQQKLVNMALTMMSRNVVLGGFLERVMTNAQMPGKWVDEHGNETADGTGTFQPDPMFVGAGALNILQGTPIYDEMGQVKGYAPVGVHWRDPVKVDTFRDTLAESIESMYAEAQQLHALMSGDATASGRSRIQATNDFVASLGISAVPLENAVRFVLETVLALASHLSRQPRRFAELRATVKMRLSAVQPEADDVRSTVMLLDSHVISRETARSRVGIEDTDAEAAKVAAEQEGELERLAQFRPMAGDPGADVGEDDDEGDDEE